MSKGFQMHFEGKGESKAKKPYYRVCTKACFFAKHEKCVCHCGGLYHGLGVGEKSLIDFALPEDLAKQFREQIKDFRCRWCGEDLEHERIRYYEHSGGWKVKGIENLQWLYIICPKCDYQWALWKLGVSRDFEATV